MITWNQNNIFCGKQNTYTILYFYNANTGILIYWSDSIAGLTYREAIDDCGEIDGLTIRLKIKLIILTGYMSVNHCGEEKK